MSSNDDYLKVYRNSSDTSRRFIEGDQNHVGVNVFPIQIIRFCANIEKDPSKDGDIEVGGILSVSKLGIGVTNNTTSWDVIVNDSLYVKSGALRVDGIMSADQIGNGYTCNVSGINLFGTTYGETDFTLNGTLYGALNGPYNFISQSNGDIYGSSGTTQGLVPEGFCFYNMNSGYNNSTPTLLMAITGASGNVLIKGDVGIGTMIPSCKLDVSGNASISGTLDVGDNITLSNTICKFNC